MRNRNTVAILASLLWACIDYPPLQGVGSFQFSSTGADLTGGTATMHVTVTAEFGFHSPVAVTLSDAPSGLTADPLTVPAGGSTGALVLHGQPGLVLDQPVTVTGTSGDMVLDAPAWVTSGFDTGSLDASFGDNGIATVASKSGCGGLALQGDGEVVVGLYGGTAGPGSLARLTADGRLDAGFGQNGVAALAGTAGGPHQITVGDDGTIFAAGDEIGAGARTHGRLWKLDGRGAPDASFGNGGYAEPIGIGSYALSVSGGKTYILGSIGSNFGYLALMTADGSLDPQLGSAGLVQGLFFGSAAPLAGGSGWLITGTKGVFSAGTLRGRLAVLSVDGEEDPVVDDAGAAMSAFSSPLSAPNGTYVVFTQFDGFGRQTGFIQKLRADLSADTSFVAGADLDSVIQLVAVQANGKLLVVKSPGSQVLDHVVRLNADGTPDPTVRTAIGKLVHGRILDGARLICGPALDAQGRLLLGYEGLSTSAVSLVRVRL